MGCGARGSEQTDEGCGGLSSRLLCHAGAALRVQRQATQDDADAAVASRRLRAGRTDRAVAFPRP
eukprot:5861533-Prymnesium_polylepis.1